MKIKKTERIAAIVKILLDNPNRIYTLGYFSDSFHTAKSTLSEDIVVVKTVFEKLSLGKIITIAGASGGIKYIPYLSSENSMDFLKKLCEKIADPERQLVGDFLYLIDLIYNPVYAKMIGEVFASVLDYSQTDYIVTIETKGIPMAHMTARAMNLPLLIIRKNVKISEGPTLGINYLSGTSGTIQSMSLSRRAIKPNSKVILIDDFMRKGGTLRGMEELMKEFNAEVVAKGVFMEMDPSQTKEIEQYISLIHMMKKDDGWSITPNKRLFKGQEGD